MTRNAENFAQNSSEDNLGNICAVYLQHSMIFKAGLVASIVSEQKFSFHWTSASQIFVTFGEKSVVAADLFLSRGGGIDNFSILSLGGDR